MKHLELISAHFTRELYPADIEYIDVCGPHARGVQLRTNSGGVYVLSWPTHGEIIDVTHFGRTDTVTHYNDVSVNIDTEGRLIVSAKDSHWAHVSRRRLILCTTPIVEWSYLYFPIERKCQ